MLLVEGWLSFHNQHLTLTLSATIKSEGFHSKTLYNHFRRKKKKVWSHTCSLRNVTVSESHIPTLIVTHNCLVAGFPFRKCMVCLNLTHVTYSHVEVLLIVIIPPLHTSCEEIHS